MTITVTIEPLPIRKKTERINVTTPAINVSVVRVRVKVRVGVQVRVRVRAGVRVRVKVLQEDIRDLQGNLSVVRCIDRPENVAHVSDVFLSHLKRHQHESSLLQFPVPDSG